MHTHFTKTEPLTDKTEHWHIETENQPYHLFVSTPDAPVPASGFPVIYVLDGNAFFHTIQEQVRIQSRRSDKTGVKPSIIIGIGYPGKEDFVGSRRFYDFTPPSPSVKLPPRPNGGEWPETGGSDHFISFIEDEVKPFVQQRYPINENDQTLFGHSLGGLFTLEMLFTRPGTFSAYIASSPSIWWNEQSILNHYENFSNDVMALDRTIKLFISVGSQEKDYMISDANDLAERLGSLDPELIQVGFFEAAEENHLSVVPTTLSRALRFTGGE